MSKSNSFENDVLKKTFNDVDFSWLPLADFYIALHTDDPGEAGTQDASECAYTSYARVAVSRDADGWTVSGNQASNTAVVQFPTCAGGEETATHFSIGTAISGAAAIVYSGELTSSLAISKNIRPEFAAGELTISED
jgi:hypothetical protein